MRDVGGFGVVENTVPIGPLTLRASLRLFARLTPFLETENDRKTFVLKALPAQGGQDLVTLQSRELSPVAGDILRILGEGHPAKIVKLACESDISVLRNLLRVAGAPLEINSEPDGENSLSVADSKEINTTRESSDQGYR